MAETAVGLVIDHLIPLLSQQVNLLRGVRSEVLSIKHELEFLQCYLKDADMRAEMEGDGHTTSSRDGVKAWVKRLREVAFKIEDVVDEYTLHLSHGHPHRPLGLIDSLHKVCTCIVKLKQQHHIASQIRKTKAHVHEIKQTSAWYGFGSIEHVSTNISNSQKVSWYDPRKEALYLREAEVVGIESPRDELVGCLLDKEMKRTVISVVGMGGLGKTTLARKVYESVKRNFDCHAWIVVSQSYTIEELLRSLIREFYESKEELPPSEINTMNEVKLTEKLRDYLQPKRYVVFFDDVWKLDFWGEVEHALLDNKCSGRIVITTRSMDVANFCKKSSSVYIHKLKPLPLEMSLELFCKKVFQFESDQGHCPTELEKLSREIVERCDGLPLAIVSIAGLLSTKDKTIHEWQKLNDCLSSELESNPHLTSIARILSLSYNDLPHYLKSCFLYFGLYPEDYSIKCKRLFRQWIAEGFVNHNNKDKTLEATAQEYLGELVHRSLVQVSKVDLNGKATTCCIHDLLREVILNKMKSLSFCKILSGDDRSSTDQGITRRLSIFKNSYASESSSEHSGIRCILIFTKDEISTTLLSTFITNFKLLRVLDFEDALLDCLPKAIGNLFHLRYLSVRNTKVKMLPSSIGKLVNLETLDLKQSLVYEIPMQIRALCKLRYLVGYYHDYKMNFCVARLRGIKVERGIGRLKDLRKLSYLDASETGVEEIKELQMLTQLRKLGIYKLRNRDGRSLCNCIEEMKYLESLVVCAISEHELIDLESLSSAPQSLQSLSLDGRLWELPKWITKLDNLIRLHINWSKLEYDPVRTTLKHLHNLVELRLGYDAYDGEEMQFEKGVFPKLKKLWLTYSSRMSSVVIEEGALPNLEKLFIRPRPLLKEMPSGIHHLRNLKVLMFVGVSREFRKTMLPEGEHHQTVQHIPRVLFRYKRNAGKYKTFPLD